MQGYIGSTIQQQSQFNWLHALSVMANISTIVAVIFAFIGLIIWRRNYRVQRAEDYCIKLLKKIRLLHSELQNLRVIKPLYEGTPDESDVMDQIIMEDYIPRIEKLHQALIDITTELFVAQDVLLRHQNVKQLFDEVVYRKICLKIFHAAKGYQYCRRMGYGGGPGGGELWQILYPDNISGTISSCDSINLVGAEIVNDELTKLINLGFAQIYEIIESNMSISKNSSWRCLWVRLGKI